MYIYLFTHTHTPICICEYKKHILSKPSKHIIMTDIHVATTSMYSMYRFDHLVLTAGPISFPK